jgi:hypothetical protein
MPLYARCSACRNCFTSSPDRRCDACRRVCDPLPIPDPDPALKRAKTPVFATPPKHSTAQALRAHLEALPWVATSPTAHELPCRAGLLVRIYLVETPEAKGSHKRRVEWEVCQRLAGNLPIIVGGKCASPTKARLYAVREVKRLLNLPLRASSFSDVVATG